MRRTRQIPCVPATEFETLLSCTPDLLSESPYVVSGFAKMQPASDRWRDFSYLRKMLGHLPVTAGAPQFTTNIEQTICRVRTNYGKYLDYIEDPATVGALFATAWVNGNHELFAAQELPLYCGDVRFAFAGTEEIISDLAPYAPRNLPIWNALIPFYYQLKNHVWLYVALKNSLTPLHQDNNGVISCLSQYKGQKSATLFSPADKERYHSKAKGYMDVLHPNASDYPSWTDATAWTAQLCEGDTLFFGANWAHHVVTVEDSVTSSIDIVNGTNIDLYFASTEWKHSLGQLARRNPHSKFVSALDMDDPLSAYDDVQLGARIMHEALRGCLRKCSDDKRSIYQKMYALSEQQIQLEQEAHAGQTA